ncbi:MAG: hypothetical protein F6K23_24725 [Okeania sp. SIO2C9]|uniref:hypothetical protein n=1 Tax=Okeania sp. SIO2C9 TaxID=2607791 RepID=UPI0013BFD3C6|nr:hypothetical protein [Okeania sp. SIO2C9]NEQ75956.1 hypothetical protein [Okeania sp. SIO2C9]
MVESLWGDRECGRWGDGEMGGWGVREKLNKDISSPLPCRTTRKCKSSSFFQLVSIAEVCL